MIFSNCQRKQITPAQAANHLAEERIRVLEMSRQLYKTIMKNPLIIIVGHYGSGKSEFAVNLVLKKNNEYPVCLVDLDIINTYFRSREVREFLNNKGIEVVSDTLNSTKGLDMPYLSLQLREK